jgi:hypothetical protein
MNTELRELTSAELDETAGAAPNLGGYAYCVDGPAGGGLYAGGCPMTWGDLVNQMVDAAYAAAQAAGARPGRPA